MYLIGCSPEKPHDKKAHITDLLRLIHCGRENTRPTIPYQYPKKMKQTFHFIINLLPFVAAAAILAWLLPVRVTLTLLIFCQMVSVALFGELLKQRKPSSENPETTERPDSSETPTPHEQA